MNNCPDWIGEEDLLYAYDRSWIECKGEMGPGTDVWPHCTSLDNRHSRECMPAMIEDEDPEDFDHLSETKFAKPPRNGPPVRHSLSEALLVDTSNLVSK